MDISGMTPALSALQSYDAGSSVSQTSLSYAVSTELLSQQLDMTQEMGTAMVQMMEHRDLAEILTSTFKQYIFTDYMLCRQNRKNPDTDGNISICTGIFHVNLW